MNAPGPPPVTDDGRYRLERELGRGAVGVVFRAAEVATDRPVALEVATGALDPTRLGRFEREGAVAARLDHPGIVRVHSAGAIGGRPYLACELIEDARPLHEAWPPADDDVPGRGRRVRDAALALGYARARGCVHRDVKLENLLGDPHRAAADLAKGRARARQRASPASLPWRSPERTAEAIAGRGGWPGAARPR